MAARGQTFANTLKMILLTVFLGAFAGLVVWCFMKAVAVCSSFIWEIIPERTGTRLLAFPICAAGGVLVGLLHKHFGDYPEEMTVVMDKVKRDKYYSYQPMPAILACAFIPLVLGSSVGPEAALVGIISALCYWVGDNVTFARQNVSFYSSIAEAVALGQLFHAPLFGILAVEEEEQGAAAEERENGGAAFAGSLTKPAKLFYYGISTASGFLAAQILSSFFGKAMEGFPSFSKVSVSPVDYVLMLLYIPVGFLLCLLFEKAEALSERAAALLPDIAREAVCGLLIAAMSLMLPIVLFSGEEEMAGLMLDYGSYTAAFLILICIVKLVLTAFCIRLGMKGGHFFPVIFACVCMGFSVAMLIFKEPAEHLAFAAAIVTSSALGAQIKKPFAVSVLMLLCFPARILFWVFLSAALSGQAAAFFGSRKKGHASDD